MKDRLVGRNITLSTIRLVCMLLEIGRNTVFHSRVINITELALAIALDAKSEEHSYESGARACR